VLPVLGLIAFLGRRVWLVISDQLVMPSFEVQKAIRDGEALWLGEEDDMSGMSGEDSTSKRSKDKVSKEGQGLKNRRLKIRDNEFGESH